MNKKIFFNLINIGKIVFNFFKLNLKKIKKKFIFFLIKKKIFFIFIFLYIKFNNFFIFNFIILFNKFVNFYYIFNFKKKIIFILSEINYFVNYKIFTIKCKTKNIVNHFGLSLNRELAEFNSFKNLLKTILL